MRLVCVLFVEFVRRAAGVSRRMQITARCVAHQPAYAGRSPQRLLIAVLACWFVLASTAAAGDTWPLYRGNEFGQGVAQSVLPRNPEVIWKFEVPEGAFLAAAAIDGDSVYVGDADGKLYCLALADGKEKWNFKTEIGFAAAPALKEGRLFVGDSDGTFHCLDADTGKKLWQFATDAVINSSANFYKESVLFGSQDGSLCRLRRSDGKLIWKYTIEADGGIQCSPTVVEGRAFVAGCDGRLHVIDLDAGRALSSLQIGAPTLTTPAVRGDYVYFGTEGAQFLAVQWAIPRIAWTYQNRRRPMAFRSSAAVAQSLVVVGGRDKLIRALDRGSGMLRWTFAARGRVDSSPVVSGERVYVGSADGRIYGLSLKTGDLAWQYEAGGRISASPAVAQQRMVIGNENGTLYCFGKK